MLGSSVRRNRHLTSKPSFATHQAGMDSPPSNPFVHQDDNLLANVLDGLADSPECTSVPHALVSHLMAVPRAPDPKQGDTDELQLQQEAQAGLFNLVSLAATKHLAGVIENAHTQSQQNGRAAGTIQLNEVSKVTQRR